MSRWLLLAASVLAAGPLPAQVSPSMVKAAETITEADVARRVGIIADDSMGGRGTPSRGLTLTAQYVASQFQQFGLKPSGDKGTWFQYFPVGGADSAPNVVGLLEGTDPQLKGEYLVISAHMDHLGRRTSPRGGIVEQLLDSTPPPPGDSIYNGADDNASGTTGVVELAKAFTRPGARPRRSLIFLTVSGEEGGLRGSHYFVQHSPVPLEQIVTDINLDMIGRSRADSVSVYDGRDSYLGAMVNRIASAHPELRLTLRPRGSSEASDQASFARRGVPNLFFVTGAWHSDYHRVTDSPEKINANAETRILRLVFYTAREAANADQRPPRPAPDSTVSGN